MYRRFSMMMFGLGGVLFAAAFLMLAQDAAAQQRAPGVTAEDFLNLDIRTTEGEDVGSVRDVIFDRRGRIQELIVDVGGFLGIGGRTVSVSPRELRFNPEEGYAVYQGTRNDLENKQEIDYYGFRYGRGYYPQRPYGYPPYYGYGYYDPYYDRFPYRYHARRYPPRGYYGRDYGPQAMEQERREQFMRDQERRRMEGEGRYYQPRDEARRQMEGEDRHYPQRGREMRELSMDAILNAIVRNQEGDNVGRIQNLVIDQRGRITHAIVGVGGFLGIGRKDVAVPFNELESIGPYFVFYHGTQEELERMPEFDTAQVRGWTGRVERQQGEQPSPQRQGGQVQRDGQQNTRQGQ